MGCQVASSSSAQCNDAQGVDAGEVARAVDRARRDIDPADSALADVLRDPSLNDQEKDQIIRTLLDDEDPQCTAAVLRSRRVAHWRRRRSGRAGRGPACHRRCAAGRLRQGRHEEGSAGAAADCRYVRHARLLLAAVRQRTAILRGPGERHSRRLEKKASRLRSPRRSGTARPSERARIARRQRSTTCPTRP